MEAPGMTQHPKTVLPDVCLDRSHAQGIITKAKPQSRAAITSNSRHPIVGRPTIVGEVQTAPPVTHAPEVDSRTARRAQSKPQPQTAPPVAHLQSYCPTGTPGSEMPLGKYYPTNYEARHKKKDGMTASVKIIHGSSPPNLVPASPTSVSSTSSSSPHQKPPSLSLPRSPITSLLSHKQTPSPLNPSFLITRPPQPTRPATEQPTGPSEQAQKLQYRRDMVAQLAQKAKEVVSMGTQSGIIEELDEETQRHLERCVTLLSVCSKPIAPKITPTILSPGPVTPMTLDGDGAGEADYLTAKTVERRVERVGRPGVVGRETA